MRFFFLTFLIFPLIANSQDIIIKTSGEELNVKVGKVLENRIIYTKSDPGDTSRYSISIVDVFMIKYSDGVKAVFNEDQKPETQLYRPKPELAKTTSDRAPFIESPITIVNKSYFIQDFRFNHKRVASILRESNNQKVHLNLQKYRSSQRASRILAYGSIPVGILTYLFGSLYLVENTGYPNRLYSTYFAAATAVGGVVFLGMQTGNIYLRKVTRYRTLNRAVDAHNSSLK